MPRLASVLRQEVRRVAANDLQKVLRRLARVQKQVKAVRSAARKQGANLASVENRVRRLRELFPARGRTASRPGPRMAPAAIRALRRKRAMTRVQFASLVGVSPGSIFGWETGRTVPRGRSRARLAQLAKKGGRRRARRR